MLSIPYLPDYSIGIFPHFIIKKLGVEVGRTPLKRNTRHASIFLKS
jgi:hypothetical protein